MFEGLQLLKDYLVHSNSKEIRYIKVILHITFMNQNTYLRLQFINFID